MQIAEAGMPFPRQAPVPSWRDYLDPSHLARRPRWVLAMVLAATLYAVMPAVHVRTFGLDRIATSTVRMIEEARGMDMASGSEALVRDYVAERSSAGAGVSAFLVTLVCVVVAGGLLNMGALLVDAEISGAQALSVAALTAIAVGVLRILYWTFAVGTTDLAAAAAPDWLHVMPVNLGIIFRPEAGSFWFTVAYSTDLTLLVGVAISALLITGIAPRTSFLAATLASLAWPATVILSRVLLSLVTGVPPI